MTLEMLVDNAAYAAFALVSLMLIVPRARFVRVFVALFASVQLALALATSRDQTSIIWMSVLLGIASLLIIADIVGHRRVRLSAEEQAMVARLLPGVSRSSARHFLDQGFWLNGQAGDVLITEGQELRNLCYLSDGEARAIMSSQQVGSFGPGNLLGERALFSGETAPATVVLATRARFWCAPAERLQPYFDVHTHLRRAIERNASGGGSPKPIASAAVGSRTGAAAAV